MNGFTIEQFRTVAAKHFDCQESAVFVQPRVYVINENSTVESPGSKSKSSFEGIPLDPARRLFYLISVDLRQSGRLEGDSIGLFFSFNGVLTFPSSSQGVLGTVFDGLQLSFFHVKSLDLTAYSQLVVYEATRV